MKAILVVLVLFISGASFALDSKMTAKQIMKAVDEVDTGDTLVSLSTMILNQYKRFIL